MFARCLCEFCQCDDAMWSTFLGLMYGLGLWLVVESILVLIKRRSP